MRIFHARSFICALMLCLLPLALIGCGAQGDDADGSYTPADADREHVDAMTEEHADETAVPSPAVEGEPAMPVKTEEVVYATVDGTPSTGYLARPAEGGEGAPAILVIHEWWGLNDNIRAMARGKAADDAEGARALMMASMDHREALEENLRQAYSYLEGQGAPRIGSIGWCFGGGWSLRAALLQPTELDGAVIYYGRLETDPAILAPLEVPILGLFGEDDQGIPVDSVHAFASALADLGKDASIHVYPGANHAFANPSGSSYEAEAAQDAWARTLSFFERTLQGKTAGEMPAEG